MAFSASISLLFYALCLCCCLQSTVSQTFQYSRGWTNGKRSGVSTPIPQLKVAQQLINGDDIPEMCKYNKIDSKLMTQSNLSVDVSTDSLISHDSQAIYPPRHIDAGQTDMLLCTASDQRFSTATIQT